MGNHRNNDFNIYNNMGCWIIACIPNWITECMVIFVLDTFHIYEIQHAVTSLDWRCVA